jgi:hypothetical protein
MLRIVAYVAVEADKNAANPQKGAARRVALGSVLVDTHCGLLD